MPAEDDLKLLRQLLTARSMPVALESENEDTLALFNDMVSIRNTLVQFSRGNFDFDVTSRSAHAAALKTLQANMRHLTWQVEQVAKGDFTQRVDFMGAFSDAFNSTALQLERTLTELKESNANLVTLTTNLKTSVERWNLVAQCSHDGIWDINIDTGAAWYSDSFLLMMQYSPEDIPQGLHWETMIHHEDLSKAESMLNMLQGIGEILPFVVHCRLRKGRLQEDYLWIRFRGTPVSSDTSQRLIIVATDITSQKKAEEKLKQQAMYDQLTGLPNRYMLDDRLKQAIANVERFGQAFVFVMLDLDLFKDVNHKYGYAAGDLVLIELAKRLNIGLRSTDTVARLGGDEFVAIYPCAQGYEQITAENVIHRSYEHFKSPVRLGEIEYQSHLSMGIVFFPRHAQNLPALLEYADCALYKAKKNGKNQYAFYEPGDKRS